MNDFLKQKVNFIISVIFMGSFALLGIHLMLGAADMANPIADHLTLIAQEL